MPIHTHINVRNTYKHTHTYGKSAVYIGVTDTNILVTILVTSMYQKSVSAKET